MVAKIKKAIKLLQFITLHNLEDPIPKLTQIAVLPKVEKLVPYRIQPFWSRYPIPH